MSKIEFGDCRETMRRWASEGIKAQTCVTSPPYYGLRDYGTGKWVGGDENCSHKRDSKYSDKTITGHANKDLTVGDAIYKSICPKCGAVRKDEQLGLEETPEEYIKSMVEVFRCVWDVLEDDGTLWVNIGDSYCGTGSKGNWVDPKNPNGRNGQSVSKTQKLHGYKSKDLIGIPWMLAFALRADGWYLRQDIIWHKPNPMPESVQDRCTKAHEYIFLFSKKQHYHFDHESIKEEGVIPAGTLAAKGSAERQNQKGVNARPPEYKEYDGQRNKRSVWTVTTKPYEGAHFAVFPTDLIEPCILAGAPVGAVVLDPFMGSGTTAQVAQNLGRKYLGCELNPAYQPLQNKRLAQYSLDLA
jgi:DNA modification methylase